MINEIITKKENNIKKLKEEIEKEKKVFQSINTKNRE